MFSTRVVLVRVAAGLVAVAALAFIGDSVPSALVSDTAAPIRQQLTETPQATPTAEPYPAPEQSATPTPTRLPGGLLMPPAEVVSDTVTVSQSLRWQCLSDIAEAFETQSVTPMLGWFSGAVEYGRRGRFLNSAEAAEVVQGFFDAGSQPVFLGYLDSGLHMTLYTSGWRGPVAVPTPVTPVPTEEPGGLGPPVSNAEVSAVGSVEPRIGLWWMAVGDDSEPGCYVTGFGFDLTDAEFYDSARREFEQNEMDYESDVEYEWAPYRVLPPIYHRLVDR